jgi:hypothetical protein
MFSLLALPEKSRKGHRKLASHEVAGKPANKNMRPEGTLGNLTTNISHRILRRVFGEKSHISLEMILFGGVLLG